MRAGLYSVAQDEHPRKRMLIARKSLKGPLRGPLAAASNSALAHETLARSTDERHGLGEEHAHGVAQRNSLLVDAAARLHLLQRCRRQLDRGVQRQRRGPMRGCCGPRWSGCRPTSGPAAGRRWSWPTPSSPVASPPTPSATSRSAASARSRPASSTAPTTSRSGTCTGRRRSPSGSATPGPPTRCRSASTRIPRARGWWSSTRADSSRPSSWRRRSTGRCGCCAATSTTCSPTRRWPARRPHTARSPSPTRYARWAPWTGSGSASRTPSCSGSNRGVGRSRSARTRRRSVVGRTTSTCAATSSPTCAAGTPRRPTERALFAEAVEASRVERAARLDELGAMLPGLGDELFAPRTGVA